VSGLHCAEYPLPPAPAAADKLCTAHALTPRPTTHDDSHSYGLDSKDANFGIEIVKVKVPLKPSLGLSLEEMSRGRDGRGMTLVAGMQPGSNAEKCGE
jgi:hypothetical protein